MDTWRSSTVGVRGDIRRDIAAEVYTELALGRSRQYLGHISRPQTSATNIGNKSRPYLGDISAISATSRPYLGHISATSRPYLGDISGVRSSYATARLPSTARHVAHLCRCTLHLTAVTTGASSWDTSTTTTSMRYDSPNLDNEWSHRPREFAEIVSQVRISATSPLAGPSLGGTAIIVTGAFREGSRK